MRDTWLVVVMGALLCVSIGCGDDDGGAAGTAGSGGSGGTAGTAGSGGGGGTAGTAGSGGGGGTAGTAGSGGGDATRDATCGALCAVIDSLNCPEEDPCTATCNQGWDSNICQSQVRALLTCSSAIPASQWECDSFGEADVTVDTCEAENDAFFDCLGTP